MLWSGPEVASSVIWTLLSTESREVLFGVGKSQDPSPQPQAEQVTCSSLRAQTSACSAAHSVLLGVVKEQQTQAFLRAGGNLYVLCWTKRRNSERPGKHLYIWSCWKATKRTQLIMRFEAMSFLSAPLAIHKTLEKQLSTTPHSWWFTRHWSLLKN